MPEETAQGGGAPAKRYLAIAGPAIAALAGLVGLLFTVFPGMKPCLGGPSAEFTGAPVFPDVRFRDHLIRTGTPKKEVLAEPNLRGAEVRFSFKTSDLRNTELMVAWSLVSLERDDTLGAVVRGQDRALAMTLEPDSCSDTGGKDLFLQIDDPRQRYRVVLELYRGRGFQDRLALVQTEPFRLRAP